MNQDKIKELVEEIRSKYGNGCLEITQQLVEAVTEFELNIFKKSLEQGFAKGDKLTEHDYNISLGVYSASIIDFLMRHLGVDNFDVEQNFLDIFNARREQLRGGGTSDS